MSDGKVENVVKLSVIGGYADDNSTEEVDEALEKAKGQFHRAVIIGRRYNGGTGFGKLKIIDCTPDVESMLLDVTSAKLVVEDMIRSIIVDDDESDGAG